MDHKEFTLKSTDELALYGQSWTPEEAPEGVIALVHGFGEHSSRYKHWAERFVSKHFALISFDLRGHGNSEGKQGHTPSYERLMNDIDVFLYRVRNYFPGVPLFLYGHSMGGNLVLNYAIDRNPEVSGVIATGPWLRLKKELPGIVRAPVEVLQWFLPGLVIPSGLDTDGLSRDKTVVKAYDEDPLVHGMISLKMFFSIRNSGIRAIKEAAGIKCPLLVVHGADDPICDPDASQQLIENARGDKTLKLWKGLFHEVHNEPEKDEVFDFIFGWIKEHMPAKS
ncbi:MAG: alpha/beta hydrolase [Chlorobi bacterium]|nr:alpha/beta hydrolase [Chlorobiota bacterium]